MNCKTAQSLLSAYIDDELTGREMLEMREHIAECIDCADELRAVEAVKHLLGSSPIPEPSQDFEDRLVSNVLAATATPATPKKISIFTLAGIAAASMLITLTAINLVGHSEPSSISMEKSDVAYYDAIQRDRAFSAVADPLGGSPVMPVSFENGR